MEGVTDCRYNSQEWPGAQSSRVCVGPLDSPSASLGLRPSFRFVIVSDMPSAVGFKKKYQEMDNLDIIFSDFRSRMDVYDIRI